MFLYMIVFHIISQDHSLEPSFPRCSFLHWILFLCHIPNLWTFKKQFYGAYLLQENLTLHLFIQQWKITYWTSTMGQWLL